MGLIYGQQRSAGGAAIFGAEDGVTSIGASSSVTMGSFVAAATAAVVVSASAAVAMGAFTSQAQASAAVTASSAMTMGSFTSQATAALTVGASSDLTMGSFTGQAQASVSGDFIETFDAYATANLFIAKYGLAETAGLLADEERLLTDQLLQDVVSGTWTGSPTDAEKAAARSALSRLNRQLATSSRFMDGYLRTVTALPLPPGDANAGTLEDCCLALARCGLADDCDNSTERMEAACDKWRAWLKDIAARRVQLVAPSGQAEPVSGGVRGSQARSRFDWDSFGGVR